MSEMTGADLPLFSPGSGGTTVQSFEGPKSSSREGRMHIFPADDAQGLYYKAPFLHCILFSVESNDVAEISVPMSKCSKSSLGFLEC